MLDIAAAKPGLQGVTFAQADLRALPFETGRFDAVVCGFGMMFPADKIAAYRELRRVTRAGRRLLFTVWDRIEDNPLQHLAELGAGDIFPDDPPRFLSRTPYGYHDPARIEAELRAAGYGAIAIEALTPASGETTAQLAAVGGCQGTRCAARSRRAIPTSSGPRPSAPPPGSRPASGRTGSAGRCARCWSPPPEAQARKASSSALKTSRAEGDRRWPRRWIRLNGFTSTWKSQASTATARPSPPWPATSFATSDETGATAFDRLTSASVTISDEVESRQLGSGAPGDQRLLERGAQQRAGGLHHEVIGREIGRADLGALGQRVVGAHEQRQDLGPEHADLEGARIDRGGNAPDDEIVPAEQQVGDQHVAGRDIDMGLQPGMQPLQPLQHRHDEIDGRGGDRAQADRAEPPARDIVDLAPRLGDLEQHGMRPGRQRRSRDGQSDPARPPLAQPVAHDRLGLRQQPRGRRLGDRQRPRRGGQLAGIGQGGEQPQMRELQAAPDQALGATGRLGIAGVNHVGSGMTGSSFSI